MRINAGLFRGKATTTGEWLYGSLLKVTIKGCPIWIIFEDAFDITGDIVKAMSHACVDPDTVGECTGIPDKNGKLIFEGDAYRYFDDEIQIVEWHEYSHTIGLHTFGEHEVKKGRKIEKRKFEGWNDLTDYPLEEMEYLGNIHDNPELLKGGEG